MKKTDCPILAADSPPADSPLRFKELQRRMPKMTHATLSVQLKTLISKKTLTGKALPGDILPPPIEAGLPAGRV